MAAARLGALAAALLMAAGCSAAPAVTPSGAHTHPSAHPESGPGASELAPVLLATAAAQDVAAAEALGYASTRDTLGCFQDPDRGGMGLHYVNSALMDDKPDARHPEAFVYELAADGGVAGLVALKYIVPIEAWHQSAPPELFGTPYHKHATLPLWVLHLWVWKSNLDGIFADFNPAVRQCPAGVPIFGRDLPKPAPTTPGR